MYRTLGTFGFAIAFALATGAARGQLVAQYEFNESSGTTVSDSIGSADGTATSGVSFVASTAGVNGTGFGNAGSFDGVTSAVNFGSGSHPAVFDLGTDDFTISGWFKLPTNFVTGVYGNKPIFQNIDYAGGGWVFEVGRADRSYRGKVFFTVGGGSSTVFNATQAFSDVRLDDDVWHWIAVTNSTGHISMYVDGVLQLDTGDLVAGTSTATAPAATEAQFGARGTSQAPFDGQLDDWRIYTEALTGTLDGGSSGTLTSGALYDVWQANSAPAYHPGDANGDGMVNLADLQILGDNWQSTTANWSQADFTGDGNVNLADLQILGDNWGYGVSPDLSFDEALAQVAIPEPASLALLLIPGAMILRRRVNR